MSIVEPVTIQEMKYRTALMTKKYPRPIINIGMAIQSNHAPYSPRVAATNETIRIPVIVGTRPQRFLTYHLGSAFDGPNCILQRLTALDISLSAARTG
jgi:hypothetical protein